MTELIFKIIGWLALGILVLLYVLMLFVFFWSKIKWQDNRDKLLYEDFRNNRRHKSRKIVSTALYQSWVKKYDIPQIAPLQLANGTAIVEESGILWHLLNDKDVESDYSPHLAIRSDPGDLVLLSLTSQQDVEFADKRRLYHSLELLRGKKEWRHLGLLPGYARIWRSSYARDTEDYDFWVALNGQIRRTLTLTGMMQLDIKDKLLCRRHARRFIEYSSYAIRHAACPVCKGPQFGLQIDKVIAVLDNRRGWSMLKKGDVLYVNYLVFEAMFDFDSIEIGSCTPDDIDAFIVASSNDPFISGLKRRQKAAYQVLPNVVLDERSKRNLDKMFGGR